LQEVTGNLELKLSQIDILSQQEKTQVLFEFNDEKTMYPRNKTIHQLFEEQVKKVPDHIAVVGTRQLNQRENNSLTYRELNGKANQLAGALRYKGLEPEQAVGIMTESSVEMTWGLLAILKAGGAYLPINPQYPGKRKKYLLRESGAKILAATRVLLEEDDRVRMWEGEIIFLEEQVKVGGEEKHNLPPPQPQPPPDHRLAYIIYTSGSTGKPKGVLVEHHSVVRLVKHTNYIEFQKKHRILQTGALEFDASTFEIWGTLLNGHELHLAPKESILTPEKLKKILHDHHITTIWMTAPLFNQMVDTDIEIFQPLRNLLVGGDVLSPPHIDQIKKRYPGLNVINGYGPTENTTFSTTFPIEKEYKGNIPIGKPITNSTAYIIDQYGYLVPIGVEGELVVGGEGVARGYLNNPELTIERFCLRRPGGRFSAKDDRCRLQVQVKLSKTSSATKPSLIGPPCHGAPWTPRKNFLSEGTRGLAPLYLKGTGKNHMQSCNHASMQNHFLPPHYPIYCTGDLAKWLHNGNIEFIGRRDQQAKIRGFRIECREIENQLLTHKKIKEAVVLIKTNESGDKYLCAYIVSKENLPGTQIKKYLSTQLPGYMIPSYIIQIEKIPLTTNGKIDHKALPGPEMITGTDYVAPGNAVEKALVQLWSEVLLTENASIGINDNFFELGGHSLKATVLVSKIHKALDIKLPLAEIFRTPTIRQLSQYIKEAREDKYAAIEPVEKREYYALSSAQKRLYILQQMELDLTAYNIPEVIPLTNQPDLEKLEKTFIQLIQRHESLRTSFHMVKDTPVQKVHNRVEFDLDLHDVHDYHDFLKSFVRPFDLAKAPLLRVGLIVPLHTPAALRSHPRRGAYNSQEGKEDRCLLMVDMHHIISDGVSHEVLIKDFMVLNEDRELPPPLRIQYKDFSQWQNSREEKEKIKQQEAYWLKVFAEARKHNC
jgi:amino acid adenylation domain-containing protein